MFIPYFNPTSVGKKAVASVQGSVWRFVSCEHCQQRYAYLLELEATGEDLAGYGSAELALAKAQENLSHKKERCIFPVPCPCCGHSNSRSLHFLPPTTPGIPPFRRSTLKIGHRPCSNS